MAPEIGEQWSAGLLKGFHVMQQVAADGVAALDDVVQSEIEIAKSRSENRKEITFDGTSYPCAHAAAVDHACGWEAVFQRAKLLFDGDGTLDRNRYFSKQLVSAFDFYVFDVIHSKIRREYADAIAAIEPATAERDSSKKIPEKIQKISYTWCAEAEACANAFKAMADDGDSDTLRQFCLNYADEHKTKASGSTLYKKLSQHRGKWDPSREYSRVNTRQRTR